MTTLILLAALTQLPDPSLGRARDLAFAEVQEGWVYTVKRPRRYEDVLDPASCRILRRLACEHWECREDASADLREMPTDRCVRTLLWGLRSSDREVVERCRPILDALYHCGHCGTTGICEKRREWPSTCPSCPWTRCGVCLGGGDLRWMVDENDDELIRRDLFAK